MQLLTNLLLTAIPIILGPVMVISLSESVVTTQAVTSRQGSVCIAVLTSGYSVTSPMVISNTTWLELLLSGDIETNPGPAVDATQEYEQCLVDGLARLCKAAPSEKVRTVLGV